MWVGIDADPRESPVRCQSRRQGRTSGRCPKSVSRAAMSLQSVNAHAAFRPRPHVIDAHHDWVFVRHIRVPHPFGAAYGCANRQSCRFVPPRRRELRGAPARSARAAVPLHRPPGGGRAAAHGVRRGRSCTCSRHRAGTGPRTSCLSHWTSSRDVAALVPHPRVNLTLYHGVLAPNHRWRCEVTPSGEGQGKRAARATRDRSDPGSRAGERCEGRARAWPAVDRAAGDGVSGACARRMDREQGSW